MAEFEKQKDNESQPASSVQVIDAHELAQPGHALTDSHGTALAQFDPKEEARVRLKIDFAVMPLAALMFLFCFIDRSNIGNARLAGLEEDLGMSGYDFNSVNSIFYISYILFEFPSNILCKIVGPGWVLPILTLSFGIVSVGSGYVNNYAQLAGCRFLLGVFEAGLMPGLSYYLSRWYRHSELTFRLSLYIVMAPLAGAFGGLLASAILRLDGFGNLPGGSWRTIFVLEGVVTVVIGLISLALLTDRPETARFLNQEEKDLVINRLKSERVGTTVLLDKPSKKKMIKGALNPITGSSAIIFLFCSITIQGLAFFTPTLVKSIYPDLPVIRQQLLTVPPYAVGAVCLLSMCFASWKLNNRQWFMIGCAPPMMTGYLIFLVTRDTSARYAGIFLMASTSFILGPLCHSQSSANVVSDSARSTSIATTMFFGNLGSLISTWTFLPWDGPDFHIGVGLNFATSSLILIIGTLALLWMRWDNKKRDNKDVDSELAGLSMEEREELEWRHPGFRWKP